MADIIDFTQYQDASAELACANLLVETMEGISEGGALQGLHGMMLAWINKDGHVEYRYSENISVDSVLAMIGPVNYDCSLSLLEDFAGQEEGPDDGA